MSTILHTQKTTAHKRGREPEKRREEKRREEKRREEKRGARQRRQER
jgi:hypothetical protein